MPDIIERLRVTEADGRRLPLHDLRHEAADEIERLRAPQTASYLAAHEAARRDLLAEIERLRRIVAAMKEVLDNA